MILLCFLLPIFWLALSLITNRKHDSSAELTDFDKAFARTERSGLVSGIHTLATIIAVKRPASFNYHILTIIILVMAGMFFEVTLSE